MRSARASRRPRTRTGGCTMRSHSSSSRRRRTSGWRTRSASRMRPHRVSAGGSHLDGHVRAGTALGIPGALHADGAQSRRSAPVARERLELVARRRASSLAGGDLLCHFLRARTPLVRGHRLHLKHDGLPPVGGAPRALARRRTAGSRAPTVPTSQMNEPRRASARSRSPALTADQRSVEESKALLDAGRPCIPATHCRWTASARSRLRGRWRAASTPRSSSSSGSTPIVRLERSEPRRSGRAPREARVPEPRRLGEGPHRPRDGRGGGAGRTAAARRDDRRADLGEHRRRASPSRRRCAATAASSSCRTR